MSWFRFETLFCLVGVAGCATLLSSDLALGREREVAGVITELQMARGRVEVRTAGTVEWRLAEPFLALQAGDAIRASEDAWAVVVLSGVKGSLRVDAARSPVLVPATPPEKTKVEKAAALLQASLKFLSDTTRDTLRSVMVTRGPPRTPVVLTPRNGPVLPESLTFEWLGSRFGRYTIRIVGPRGVILERTDLTGTKFDYPADAPRLDPGARYTFHVLAERYSPQAVWFEVLDAARARSIQEDIKELERALVLRMPSNSFAVLKAGLLAEQGLLHDARLSLIAALAKDQDEPALHVLLGDLYAKSGLPELAAVEYGEAHFLLARDHTKSPSQR